MDYILEVVIMSKLTEKFENKKVLLWGYGLEGKSSENFLKKYCNVSKIEIYEGSRDSLPIDDYDYIIKSPGVPYIYTNEPKMTSQTELFLEEFKDRTIGITGTKGKSTTTSMIYKVLKENLSQKVCLLGNIGIPCLDAYEDMLDGAVGVYEMSCHQLANNTISPHIAIFLNLFEDHLDYYKTRDKYFEAKTHISKHQTSGDYLLYGESVPYFETKANKILIDSNVSEKYELEIIGDHNQWNAKVVDILANQLFNIDESKIRESLKSFYGLPHRLEKFASINGVTYYDDSISTIPEASLSAINSINDLKTIIIGGMDRGIDYSVLIDAIPLYSDINFIFCYESGKRIYESVKEYENCMYVEDLKGAVHIAKKITAAGAVVMSPAAASYGYFKNFSERGDFFKDCVRA